MEKTVEVLRGDQLLQVFATSYVVSLLPETHQAFDAYALKVEWRGNGRWSIKRRALYLSRTGDWDVEIGDDRGSEEYLHEHRWPLAEALEVAKRVAPHVRVNGFTIAQALEF